MSKDIRQLATIKATWTDKDGKVNNYYPMVRALATDTDEAIIERAKTRDHRVCVASALPSGYDTAEVVERDNFDADVVNMDEVKVGDVVVCPAGGGDGGRVGVVIGLRDPETASGLPAWAQDLVIVMEEFSHGMRSWSEPSSNMTIVGHVTPAEGYLTKEEISQGCREYRHATKIA